MTKEELHTFAAAGVAQKIASIERELAVFHKEWPELFLSPTVPQLLRPTLKNGHGNGTPAGTYADTRAKAGAASWTPARRAKMARLMRRRRKELQAAKATKRAQTQPERRYKHSAATRRKLALAMKRRHASGEIARAKAAARDN